VTDHFFRHNAAVFLALRERKQKFEAALKQEKLTEALHSSKHCLKIRFLENTLRLHFKYKLINAI
jgi:hypothetical protein